MRRLIQLSALLFLLALPAYSQEAETLFDSPVDHGGFGALVTRVTPVAGTTEMMLGAYGGWLIDHRFLLGGGGFGLVTNVPASQAAQDAYALPGSALSLSFGYGGFVMEYIHAPSSLVHMNAQLLIGSGAVSYHDGYYDDDWDDDWDNHRGPVETVFVLEPAVNVELNVTSWFRIAGGASYRYVSGIDELRGISDSDLSGVSGNLALKFGAF